MALYAFSKSEQIEMVAKLLIASGIDTDRTNHWKMKTSEYHNLRAQVVIIDVNDFIIMLYNQRNNNGTQSK